MYMYLFLYIYQFIDFYRGNIFFYALSHHRIVSLKYKFVLHCEGLMKYTSYYISFYIVSFSFNLNNFIIIMT